MNRHDLGRVLLLYFVTLVGGTVAWVALFHTSLLEGSVFFYRGIVLLALVCLGLSLVLVWLWRRPMRGLIGVRDILLILTLLVSANLLFFTHLPVTADRSISVFILAYMNRAPGPLTATQIEQAVVEEYLVERRAIEKRVEEQLVTGTLVRTDEGYTLSPAGRSLVGLYELIAGAFNIETPNLAP